MIQSCSCVPPSPRGCSTPWFGPAVKPSSEIEISNLSLDIASPFEPPNFSRRSLVRRVAVVQHQVVAVGIGEEGHVADAGVHNLAGELDALRLQLGPRR